MKEIKLLILNLIQNESQKENIVSNEGLQLSPISVNEDYCKKWNIRQEDYVCLTKNGELLRETLYRVGGMGRPKLGVDNYFMLLKYVEAFYSDEITKDKSRKPHLEGIWCIFDKEGNEKIEFKGSLSYPYLVKDSCIYTIDNNFYNIETKELYCKSYTRMESNDYLFLDNKYDKDESKRGVMKINKKDGTWELFSGK